MDNKKEIFPIVDSEGHVLGSISRGEAHDGRKILHPVVHLHVFNSQGDIYLQRRPDWKDIQPGKWDTACGGHIDFGENPEQALAREVYEELGIPSCAYMPTRLGMYVFESVTERELVYINTTIYDGSINPSAEELNGGRFWSKQELEENFGKGVFTPNFEEEYKNWLL